MAAEVAAALSAPMSDGFSGVGRYTGCLRAGRTPMSCQVVSCRAYPTYRTQEEAVSVHVYRGARTVNNPCRPTLTDHWWHDLVHAGYT